MRRRSCDALRVPLHTGPLYASRVQPSVRSVRVTGVRLVLVAVAAVLIASACATVPYTGRRQLSMVSASEELRQGDQLYAIARRRSRISHDRIASDIVQDVGRRIAVVSGQPQWRWEFTLFDDDEQVNAWALPGGKVGIYTGILPVAKDEAGLASVIGHEVAHAIAHHGAERSSQGQLVSILGMGLAVAAGSSTSGATTNLLMQAYGLGAQLGVMLPFGRAQESEADEIGLILMAKAGYDPRAAVGIWQRMGQQKGAQAAPPEFLSTHPSYGTRVQRIEGALPRALGFYEPGRVSNRPLPALKQLRGGDAGEEALLEAVMKIDRLAARASSQQTVATEIGRAFDIKADSVVQFANQASLSPGEAALAFALLRSTKIPPQQLVDDLRRGSSWWGIIRQAGASPRRLAQDLDRVSTRLTPQPRRPAR